MTFSTTILGILRGTLLAQSDGSFWMPPQASTVAPKVDALFYFIFYVSLIFFALIVSVMIVFAVRYRDRPGHKETVTATHNLALELTWSVIPLILVIIIFYFGFRNYMDMVVAPRNTYDISVTAQRWKWLFEYPNGHIDENLHVSIDQSVKLIMTSEDVIHSLFIPAFRLKRDVVPGRYNKMWFRATREGEFPLLCAEYCGTKHSDMRAFVIVHEAGGFEKWLASADPLNQLSDEQYAEWLADPDTFARENPEIQGLKTAAMMGEELFRRRGCSQCHTVDGKGSTGPTMKDFFGKEELLMDDSKVLVDEDYIRKSILEPGEDVAKGFDDVMPTYKGRLKDREISTLIAYIKSLSPDTDDDGQGR